MGLRLLFSWPYNREIVLDFLAGVNEIIRVFKNERGKQKRNGNVTMKKMVRDMGHG